MQSEERDRLSRIRQGLRQLAGEIPKVLPDLMDRSGMVKGSVYELKRKCGKPNCACGRGKPHSSIMLSRSEGGRTRLISVGPEGVDELEVLTQRYRRFRRARARLGQIYKRMVALIDQLEAARLKEP